VDARGLEVIARASQLGIVLCRVCGQIDDVSLTTRCLRCGRRLKLVNPLSSTERSLAWLIAAMMLYIPANLLPVMYVSGVGGDSASTIFGGITEFWRSGSLGLALLIFAASVAVPITKFVSLSVLIGMTMRGSGLGTLQRAKLYRFVEFIGYWSMLDVVVVALTCRLVSFGSVAVAEPRPGIVFFCAVVVLTMVSAFSFDPRSIWIGRPRA
jgi:paraquat-inducible protein A